MDAYKIAVKLFAESDSFQDKEFVPIFHRFIQESGGDEPSPQAIEEHMLIDVADYSHVPEGPGTVLIALEANISMDREGGRLGLQYWRKRPSPGTFGQRLRYAVLQVMKIAAKLENEPSLKGRLIFRTDEIVVRINDRLLAPSNEKTLAEVRGDVEAVGKEVYGQGVTIEPRLSGERLFEVAVKGGGSRRVGELVERLAVKAAAG